MTVYKIEDFVVEQMFRPYSPDFIEAEYQSCLFKALHKTIESKLRKRPELIIELLEEMPETKKRVFDRIRKFGGIKFYKYLNMENEIIKYVNANLAEMG
jgi:deoxyadenosine/deoxycytidine kinase